MTIHRFESRRFIVTGAADGIGRATAVRLINEGGQVAMLDLSGDKLKAAADELGDRGRAFTVDIAGVIAFLLSDDAAYMEGSTVVVDGATLA